MDINCDNLQVTDVQSFAHAHVPSPIPSFHCNVVSALTLAVDTSHILTLHHSASSYSTNPSYFHHRMHTIFYSSQAIQTL
eukprot:751666-Hanusia_phi.AAC.1